MVIEFRQTTKRYASRTGMIEAVSAIDLTVEEGEFVSLVGPSGCGKSTILRLAAGLSVPDSGSITIAGKTPDEARRAKLIALAPQSPALLAWRTVSHNARLLTEVNRGVGVGRVADHDEIDELLHRVGLADFTDAYPHELSGGMQQRVGLVRAFALHAPVVLMDEPFAALDMMTRTEMRYLLSSLWERDRSSVLFVTHALDEAVALSDRVAVMSARPGRVIGEHRVSMHRPRTNDQEDSVTFLNEMRAVKAAFAGVDS